MKSCLTRIIEQTASCVILMPQVALLVKNPPASARDVKDLGSIPGSGRSPGEGNGNLFQYSCQENPMDRGAWRTAVHGVAKVGHDLASKQQYPS